MLAAPSTTIPCISSGVSSESARKAICSQVAQILREERLKKNLSMTTLSARAGLSQQSVSYVERQMRIPNLDTLLRIAAVLEIDLAVIIKRATETGNKKPGG